MNKIESDPVGILLLHNTEERKKRELENQSTLTKIGQEQKKNGERNHKDAEKGNFGRKAPSYQAVVKGCSQHYTNYKSKIQNTNYKLQIQIKNTNYQ